MSRNQRVARAFAWSTQIIPARDVCPIPGPDLDELKATMVAQMVWCVTVTSSLTASVVILGVGGDNLAFRILAAIGVATAILPQLLVGYFRFKDRRGDQTELP